MGSWVTRVIGFHPAIFSLLCPPVLNLGTGTGQTDRQTDDGHQHLMPPHHGPPRHGEAHGAFAPWGTLPHGASTPWGHGHNGSMYDQSTVGSLLVKTFTNKRQFGRLTTSVGR